MRLKDITFKIHTDKTLICVNPNLISLRVNLCAFSKITYNFTLSVIMQRSKVSIVRCYDYNLRSLDKALGRVFELLKVVDGVLKPGLKVLIKPNLLSKKPPEAGANTHPEFVRSVARVVKEFGAIPIIGDNPGGSSRPKDVYESSGMARIAKEEGVGLVETGKPIFINGIPISSYAKECDIIFSLPKLKTHSLMTLTGAIKNMFGICPGLFKSECHKANPRPGDFCKVLVDVYSIVRPTLTIIDGIIGMDQDGPANGRLRNFELIIAGFDGVSVDAVLSDIIGIKPFELWTTKEAHLRGLGNGDLEEIEVLGESLSDVRVKDFVLPRTSILTWLPGTAIKGIANFINFRPVIDQRLCTKCNLCVETCPTKTITINKKVSRIETKGCINCLCCHEVCPYGAIYIKKNLLAKAFSL